MLGKRIINTGGGVSCTTDTTQILDGGTTQSIALYRFEDNANDTASGTGKFNKGGVFNGSSSKIDLPNNILPDSSAGSSSASVWFKSSSQNAAANSECILDAYSSDSSKPGWSFFMEPPYGGNPDGHLFLANYSLGGASSGTSASYRDGNWHHAVIVLDNPNNTIKVYLDGNTTTPILSQTASAANVWPFTEMAAIGCQRLSSGDIRYFNGNIDQVRIFNKALSASEITTLYNETASTINTLQILGDTSCVATYTFEGNANDLDTSTPKNGTASNVTYDYNGTESSITYVTGKFGKAASYDGTSSEIRASSFTSLSQVGISMWVNMPDISQQAGLIARYGTNREFAIYMYSGNLTASIYYNGNNGNATTITTSTYMSNNTWHHIAYTANGSTAPKLYIDGSEVGTPQHTDAAKCAYYTSSEPLDIGHFANNSSYNYEGKIDQVRIFSKELSPGEVNSLYNETTTTAALGTISNPSTIAYYKMQDATDETGSYNGTATNVDFNVQGKYGFAGLFNGTNSKISTSLTSLPESFTISCWANAHKASDNYHVIVGNYTTAGGWYLAMNNSMKFVFYNKSGSSASYYQSTATYQYGEWYHFCVVFTHNSDIKAFINGNKETFSASIPAGTNSNGVQIGVVGNYSSSTNTEFDGKIDQVRIFNKAISDVEVTKLYNEVQCANTITTPESYFNTKLYTGTGSAQSITGVGFEPGFVWIKSRTANSYPNNVLQDSVRGPNQYVISDLANAQGTNATFGSFDANGFTLTSGNVTWNGSGSDYVSWNWKAASSNTTNNDGTIASTVRASQESGFSIVKYTGNGTDGATVGHGLSFAPEIIIIKNLDSNSTNWMVKVPSIMTDDKNYLYLSDTSAVQTAGSTTFIKTVNSSIFTLGTSGQTNATDDFIAYCFHSIDGYQRIGSYAGNGSADGPFVYTGFEPAWLMIKRTDAAAEWNIFDNKRDTENPRDITLWAQANSSESTASQSGVYDVDFLSNGFQIKNTYNPFNNSSGTYLFWAIAANPDTTAPTKTNSFKAITWAGSGGATNITTVGFKPDLVLWKAVDSASYNWKAINSIRGASRNVYPNLTNAEASDVATTAFIDNGFSFGSGGNGNVSSLNFVGYAWKGLDHDRNLAAINNDGSRPSLVSANPDAGFSVVQHRSAGTFEQFGVGHGLSSAPQAIIMKALTTTGDWYLLTNVIDGSGDYIKFNDVTVKVDITGSASSLFRFDPKTFTNWWSSANTIINFCFHSVDGVSRIATYTGVTGAKRVYTTDDGTSTGSGGFSPSFIIIRNVFVAGAWMVYDSARSSTPDPLNKSLMINYASQEVVQGTYTINVHSDGFTVNSNLGATNANGNTYFYIAFA